jgi:hypothetical protein
MTVNCRSVVDKKAELAACINYTKPDIICGTDLWLKRIQPGKPTRKDAIKSSEVFPKNFKIYRNDRGTLVGGVFVGINEDLISTENTSIITECEIEWSKVKLKNNIASFYILHRNMKDLDIMRLSLDKLTNGKPKHVIIAGDFNCPDLDWVNMEIKTLELWADKWGMKFNAKKCYIMSMRQKSSYFYQLDQHILEQVKTNPYLGHNISDDLKWSSHISKITSKASCTLGFLRRNLRECPQECKKLAYLGMVRSTLEYGCLIWDPYTDKNIDKLESIQKRAARFINHDYKSRESGCVTNMLKDLELKPLQERRKHIRLTMFYKVVEGLVPAIASEDYLKEIRNKRKRKAKQYEGFETSNIIDRQTVNNSRPFELIQFKTDTRKN